MRLCSLPLQATFGGLTFYGTGAMGEISALEEGGENRSYGFSLSLSGIPGNWLDYLRSQLTIAQSTEDIVEGVTAFFEKREPVWKGR